MPKQALPLKTASPRAPSSTKSEVVKTEQLSSPSKENNAAARLDCSPPESCKPTASPLRRTPSSARTKTSTKKDPTSPSRAITARGGKDAISLQYAQSML